MTLAQTEIDRVDPAARAVVDAVVIGAGFAGIYMVYRLREMGLSVQGFEAGSGVGGTWYWNRYPGARCDSETMYYSYSFLTDLEREWPLQDRYPGQPEILRYLDHVADRLDLRKEFRFDSRVAGITFDETTGRWTVSTTDGVSVAATYVVTAVGCLSAAAIPSLPGRDSFAGETFHTGQWPHEPVTFTGKRVGIIGTGASGIQAIPVIAAEADHLTVFQRTPQFTIPAKNGPLDPRFVDMWKANYREWRRRGAQSVGGYPFGATDRSALDASPEERQQAYQRCWDQGGFLFLFGAFGDLMVDEDANRTVADFIRAKIDEIVEDPAVAEMLKPYSFPFGTKRPPLDTNYYETFNRPNVTLVDLRRTPIEAVMPVGVRTSAAEYPLDVLVYATGFDALTGPLLAMDIRGRAGRSLAEAWAEGPRTYLGLAVPGFPNLFTITGPGSPSVLSNMPVSIEQHVDWIADCIQHLRHNGISFVEATEEATATWTDHVQEVANQTLYPKAASWYMGANIPGKPRLFLPYVGGVGVYRDKCREVAANNYEGFELRAPVIAPGA
jgi:cation diffusion facilitator CzcD-associated flavoprotein CzcO